MNQGKDDVQTPRVEMNVEEIEVNAGKYIPCSSPL